MRLQTNDEKQTKRLLNASSAFAYPFLIIWLSESDRSDEQATVQCPLCLNL